MQNIIYLEIQKPLKSQTIFSQQGELLEISYMELWQDTIHFFALPSHRQESEVCHQLRPSNLKLWDMLRRPKKKHTGAHYATTPKNYQKKMFFGRVFLRVSTAKIRVIYSHFFLKRVKHNLLELHYGVLRGSTGFLRVSTGFLQVPHNTATWAPWTRWKLSQLIAGAVSWFPGTMLYCNVVDILDGTI